MGKSNKSRRPYGSGTVRRLGDNKWEAVACHGRRSDGKKRTMSRVVYGEQADAEAELVRMRVEMGARPNLGDTMTLDDYFWTIYVPDREESLKRNPNEPIVSRRTLTDYVNTYRTHIGPAFGSWPADSIGRAAVRRWVASLPSAATAEKAFRYLRAFLRAMWDDELLDEKPLERRVRLPRHQVEPRQVWSQAELDEARERLVGHPLEGLVLVMAGGGLRREEAMALNLPGDLEFVTDPGGHLVCRFTVRRAWVDGDTDLKPTKTYRVRPVTIGEPFAPRLCELTMDGRTRLAMRRDGTAPMVPTSVPETWRAAFRPNGPLHGMRFVELRTLRHLHETIAAAGGFTDSTNANLHGHSQAVMYQNYLTMAASDADRMAEVIRRAFQGDSG